MADSRKWWSKDTIAVVTGGNKGVGYEIVGQLGKQGLTVVLTARDEDRGQNAADSLKAKGLSVLFHQLDVTDRESLQAFVHWIKRELGGLHILINNAGISRQEVSFENARDIIATNYVSVKDITSALMPLFRKTSAGARIVNISTTRGVLKNLKDETLRQQLSDGVHLKQELINSLAAKFLEDVRDVKYTDADWKWASQNIMYSESKVFLNAFTRVLAKCLEKADPDDQMIFVNAVSPGCTKSDLMKNEGGQQVENGADTPVWLALLPREGYPNGPSDLITDRLLRQGLNGAGGNSSL